MIFLAGLGLTASVISLLYLSQHLIASKSNEIDQQRSVLSVEGAVQTSVNRVLSLVLDNAIWDDAVTQTYAPSLDQKWLYDSWGSGFKINNLYDGTFVLDEHYHILWGAFQSQVMPRADLAFLGAGLTSLILLFILFSSLGMYKLARGERQAREIALIDWLSRLPNRRALLLRLSQVCDTSKHDMQCVVFIDLDGFKDVNDNYGHDVGDTLIRHIASALQKRVPAGAMLARMGGDEFAMAVSGEQAIDRAAAFAWAALELLIAPVALSKRTIYIGASIGIASGTPAECSSTELFRRADIAMYHAKKSGKGRTAWYDDALDAVRRHQLMIENGIRQGLEQDEFEVWYQPVVDADTLAMTGVEALLRWPRRPQGALAPDAFIAIAESSGLIDTLGQFVLQRACSDLQPVGDLLLSVNISPAQFRDPAFESRVMETVAACRFPPSRLQVEVTESYVLENPERSQAVVENLKA